MLVSAKEMLDKAKAGHYAVGSSTLTTWSGQNLSAYSRGVKIPGYLRCF